METARFIVCEKTGQWATAFRRAGFAAGVRVCETRSLDQCWRELDASPASFLAVELTAGNLESLLARLAALGGSHPAAGAMVIASRGAVRYEWLLREAGAVHVLFSPRRAASAVGLATRHLARAPTETVRSRNRFGIVFRGAVDRVAITNFGSGGAKARAEQLQTPLLGDVPIRIQMRERGDAGRADMDLEDPAA